MVASAVQIAKITLLATKRAVALSVGMVLTCNRDSSDKHVVVSLRKLALRVLPCLIHGAACALMCSTNNCPLHGDVVLATPLRRYESSCHSQTQQKTLPKYTKYMYTDVLYLCCVTPLLCDLFSWNPCSAFLVSHPRCVFGLAPICFTKLAILGRWIPGSQILNLRISSQDFNFHFWVMCKPALPDTPLPPPPP